MTEEKLVTLEGFTWDVDYGYTFLCKPIVQELVDTTDVDRAVEDYCIDVSMGVEPEQEEPDTARNIRNAFYKVRKQNTEYRTYWKRVVKIYIGDDERVYDVIESESVGLL